ncbi:MAG: helix-turn-helix domain-containing protein [Patescibacteria group bacterium]|nr:helix-turn-helix domain-containing protein [Patescibacteria group bacterium]MDD4610607.1 helix-turn-helix domain-containing protein [Patescibacteria group bacterium]
MYQQLLTNSGLDNNQAEVLEFLLINGEQKAGDISKNTKLGRGLVYKALVELENMKLIVKKEKDGAVAVFLAEHPINIKKVLESKEKQAEEKKNEIVKQRELLERSLPDLVSVYNLSHHKPGVRYYEGDEGIREVLYDTLNSKTEIYTFIDVEAVEKNLKEINSEYAKKREKLGVKKKIIVADTDENRKFFMNYNKTITEIRYLKKEFYPFASGLQIYNGKISYQTLSQNHKIAVLIEDRNIYEMQKLFFEYIWESLEKYY